MDNFITKEELQQKYPDKPKLYWLRILAMSIICGEIMIGIILGSFSLFITDWTPESIKLFKFLFWLMSGAFVLMVYTINSMRQDFNMFGKFLNKLFGTYKFLTEIQKWTELYNEYSNQQIYLKNKEKYKNFK